MILIFVLQMQDHDEKECPKAELKCPFSIVGCPFEVQQALICFSLQNIGSTIVESVRSCDLRPCCFF